jgi:hypothetical protein
MRQATAEHAGALSLIALGAGLGPEGFGILTPTVLGLMDPLVPISLAALGVIAGLDLAGSRRADRRLEAAAAARSAIAGVIVAAGVLALATGLGMAGPAAWPLALVAGVCAALTVPAPAALPIVVGALGLGWMRQGWAAGTWLTAHTAGVALSIALAGWLLLRGSPAESDRRVFTVAMLLLIGGAADYLSTSALLGGLIAGACWQATGGAMPEALSRDVAALRPPLLAILLLVAGALTSPSAEVVALALAYALLRAGVGALAARLVVTAPGQTVDPTLPAAILAIAFALNGLRVAGSELAPALAVIVIGTLITRLCESLWGRAEVAT